MKKLILSILVLLVAVSPALAWDGKCPICVKEETLHENSKVFPGMCDIQEGKMYYDFEGKPQMEQPHRMLCVMTCDLDHEFVLDFPREQCWPSVHENVKVVVPGTTTN